MMKTSLSFTLLFLITSARCQFFYNYEENKSDERDPEYDDTSQYQYNPPSRVNQQYVRPEPPKQAPQRPPRRYEPEPEYYPETSYQDREAEAEPERRVYRRRQRRRQRTRQRYYVEAPVEQPKVYGPSVFENIGLGQAPNGVYVPQDSLLNLLKEPESRPAQPAPVRETSVAPNPRYQTAPQRSAFYVEPPTEYQEPEQRNLILPVVRAEERYSAAPAPRYSIPPSQQRSVAPPPRYSAPPAQEYSVAPPRVQSSRSRSRPRPRSVEEPRAQVYRSSEPRPLERRYRTYETAPYEPQPQRVNYVQPKQRYREEAYERPQSRPRNRARQQSLAASRQSQEIRSVTAAPETKRAPEFKHAKLAIATLPLDTDGDEIPGEAGTDYPTLHIIPETTFSCAQQPHNGYYADLETSCQVVHLCHSGGVQSSFLCPNGTIFSQEKLSCQWWYKVNCVNAPKYYSINNKLYKTFQEK